jgi:ketosteroid isomerase-like protein
MHLPHLNFHRLKWTTVCCLVLLIALIVACKQKKVDPAEKKTMENMALMRTDAAFSALSKSSGMKSAFIDYLDSNAVLLRPGKLPITGAEVIDFLIQQNDSDIIYSWDPHHAEVAESGELGYSYGVYLLQSKETGETRYGTYMSVWKKQPDGKWKLLLHSGNEGVGE